MKHLISSALILMIFAFNSIAQTSDNSSVLTTDDEWQNEIIDLPPGFAPDIGFEGYEDLRFLKGWNKPDSNEFWSYGFAWVLDDDPEISALKLSENMDNYFNGLMKIDIDAGEQKTKSSFLKTKGSANSYVGVIETVDAFFTKAPLKFNVRVETSYCEALQKHIVLFHLSPKGFDEKTWDQLNKIKPRCR